jgi:ketosteroid isomerase-like protein
MRKSLLKFFLCLSVFLSAPAAMAAPADDAAAVLTKWEKNFNSGDVDATVGLYAPGATVFERSVRP